MMYNSLMKKLYFVPLLLAPLFALPFLMPKSPSFGADALDGDHAIGIIVKNGNKIDEIIAENFTIVSEPCDPNATTTPSDLCEHVMYQGNPVNVYYTAPEHLTRPQSPFGNKIGNFPFSGRIDYVNRSEQDIEPKLIQFMLEQGNTTYELIRE